MLFNGSPSILLPGYDTERAGTFEPPLRPESKPSCWPGFSKRPGLRRAKTDREAAPSISTTGAEPPVRLRQHAPGNRLSVEQQNVKLRRVVEVAREV
jgi:hypothetical protein